MSVPLHLLKSIATITVPSAAQAVTGEPRWPNGATLTFEVACAIQPTSSSEAILFGRDMNTTMFDLFLAPTTTGGSAYSINAISTVVVSSVTYDIVGGIEDQAGQGRVSKVRVEVRT